MPRCIGWNGDLLLRSRFVIPAAVLVTVAYVKGRLDANLFRTEEEPVEVPVATPPVDPILRAQAEAADAISIAEAQTVAAAAPVAERPVAEPRIAETAPAEPPVAGTAPAAEPPPPATESVEAAARRELSHLSEWLTTPTWGAPPPRRARARERFDPGALAEWATHPASGAPRRARARESFDPARLAEWITNPTWGPLRRTMVRDVLDAAALAEWATDPIWGQTRRARTRDAFESAAVAEWITHVAPTALPEWEGVADEPPSPSAAPEPAEAGPEGPAPDALAGSPEDDAPPEQPEAEPVTEVRIDESGRFSLGGWAAQAGHTTLCGVTFRDRRDAPVDPSAIHLIPDAVSNVVEGGVVVLSDPGFAPDEDGFTVLLAAEGPGSFAASGRYEVIAA